MNPFQHLTSPLCKIFPIYWLSVLLLPLSAAHAQVKQIDVLKPGDVIPIRLPVLSGASGKEATEILTSDLKRSGWFEIVSSGGDYVVQGSAASNSIQCNVFQANGALALTANGSGNLRRAVHQVADQIVASVARKKGIAQTRIAFISDKSGNKELYVTDYDWSNVQRFTQDNSLVGSPNFSRQANQIAFTSYRSSYPDVILIGYPAGKRRTISRFPGLNSGAAFSPDGSRIALTLSKDGNPELYTMSADGEQRPKRLTRTRGGESSPSWSPDGSQIAYCSDEGGRPQIYIISSSGGRGSRLTTSPAYNTEPDWSAQSNKIAYSSLQGKDFAISVIDPSHVGSGEVVYSDGSCEDPSWAPDGRHLVFSRTQNGHSDLYILDIETKEAIQLTRNFGNCTQPSWSGR